MPQNRKIGFIGGDARQMVIARRLSSQYECAIWEEKKEIPEKTVRCRDWQSAVKGADALILPVPVSRDGKNLNGTESVSLTDLCHVIGRGTLVCAGIAPPLFREMIAEQGATLYDYYDSEEIQIKNAVPTAEGVIAALVKEMPSTIFGMNITITGYGRCARTLATRLISLGATVNVAARSEKDLACAAIDGCVAIPLWEYLRFPIASEVIINTVPVCLFDENTLLALDKRTVLFELSSGIDRTVAEKENMRVVLLPSLPGKTAPETAGNIIATVLERKLKQHFEKSEGQS